jgi:hypothetical protein
MAAFLENDELRSLFPKDIIGLVDDFLYQQPKEVVNILKKILLLTNEMSLEEIVDTYTEWLGKGDIKSFFKRNGALIYDELTTGMPSTDKQILYILIDGSCFYQEFNVEQKKEKEVEIILKEAIRALFETDKSLKLESLFPKELPKDIIGLVSDYLYKDSLIIHNFKELKNDYCFLTIHWEHCSVITPGRRKACDFLVEMGYHLYCSFGLGMLYFLVEKSKTDQLISQIDEKTYPEKVITIEYLNYL